MDSLLDDYDLFRLGNIKMRQRPGAQLLPETIEPPHGFQRLGIPALQDLRIITPVASLRPRLVPHYSSFTL